MKKYTFKDGQVIIASSVIEAIQKHKGQYEGIKRQERILEELGFKKKSWFHSIDLMKYKFEMPSGTYKYQLSLGVSNETPEFSRVFVFTGSDAGKKEDILSTFVKNNSDFKKNIQKLIVKTNKIASYFENWCK